MNIILHLLPDFISNLIIYFSLYFYIYKVTSKLNSRIDSIEDTLDTFNETIIKEYDNRLEVINQIKLIENSSDLLKEELNKNQLLVAESKKETTNYYQELEDLKQRLNSITENETYKQLNRILKDDSYVKPVAILKEEIKSFCIKLNKVVSKDRNEVVLTLDLLASCASNISRAEAILLWLTDNTNVIRIVPVQKNLYLIKVNELNFLVNNFNDCPAFIV